MSGLIPQHVIDEISQRLNPIEVIGEYVQLRRRGSTYLGLCPFHNEKTPSMNVDPDRGLWHCFGCGTGGSMFTFVQRMEGLSYFETVRLLAGKAGVTIEFSETAQQENSERLRALNLLDRAADFYHEMLLNSQSGEIGREYMISRNISRDTAVRFRLGYAPESSALLDVLHKAGFQTEEAVKCGLITENSYYGPSDIMRGRLVYPICDSQGKVLAFGGRRLDDNQKTAKYMNTPETAWYSKRRNLYGLHLAKTDIKRQRVCVLVEGYFDVISLHQVGVTTAVASCGTAFTEEQARLLKRYSGSEDGQSNAFNVLLMYDSDAAGEKATLSANAILEEAGLRAQAVFLPPGDDPDSLAQRGLQAVKEVLDSAEGVVSYKMRKLLDGGQIDISEPEGKADFVRQVMPLLRQMKDPVVRDAYLRKLSYYTGVKETSLYRLLRSPGREISERKQRLRRFSVEEELFRLCAADPQWISVVRDIVTPGMFEDERMQAYFSTLFALKDIESRQEPIALQELLQDEADDEAVQRLAELLTRENPATDAEDVKKLAVAVRDRVRRRRLEVLSKEIVTALDAGRLRMDNDDPLYRDYKEYCLLKRYFHGNLNADDPDDPFYEDYRAYCQRERSGGQN